MKKKAISYYFSLMAENRFSGFKFHETGKQAVAQIEADSRYLFPTPIIKKNSMVLTRKNRVTIGYPARKLIARFLDEEELAIYDKYGEDCVFSIEEERIAEPKKTNQDCTPS